MRPHAARLSGLFLCACLLSLRLIVWRHWLTDASLYCSHAIVSSLVGPEYYVNIMSFVDKGQLEPGCSILLHNKVRACRLECACPAQ